MCYSVLRCNVSIFCVNRFENLRIRRLKKGDTTAKGTAAGNLKQQQQPSKQQPTGLKGARTKQDEKVAYLLFTAHVQAESREIIELKVLSQAIHLSKPTIRSVMI